MKLLLSAVLAMSLPLSACGKKEDAPPAEKTEATPAEAPAEPAAAEPEPAAAEPAAAPELEEVTHERGFKLDLPAGHEVKEDDKQVRYTYKMPDGWEQSVTVRSFPAPFAKEADVKQHARDSGFKIASIEPREDGSFVVLDEKKTVADSERQSVRIYTKSTWVECGGSANHLEFNRKLCESFELTK